MRLIYSEKANELFDRILPYVDLNAFPAKLKDGTPDDIKKDYENYLKLAKEECERELRAEGLI